MMHKEPDCRAGEFRSARVAIAAMLALLFAGGANPVLAQGPAKKPRKPLYTIEAQVRGEAGREVRVTGATDLPDGADVTVYLFHAVNRTLVDTRVVGVERGAIALQFGPFDGGLYDGTYVVECTFLPGLQKVEMRLNLREYDLVATTSFAVGSGIEPAEQAAQARAVAQETILALRGLFQEVNRFDRAAKDGVLKSSELGNWGTQARQQLDAIAAQLAKILPGKKAGCPFLTELSVLKDCAENFQRLFDRRFAVNFAADALNPVDKGKTHGELLREGKAPSWILRESFIHGLVRAFNTLGIRDPSEQALEDVSASVRDALLVLMRAYTSDGIEPCRELTEFDRASEKFKGAQERVAAAFADIAVFFEDRQELLGAEEDMFNRYSAMREVSDKLASLLNQMRKAIGRTEPLDAAGIENVVELCRKLSTDSVRFCCEALQSSARQLGGVVADFTSEMPSLTASSPWGAGGTGADEGDEERWRELRDARVAGSMRQFEGDFAPLKAASGGLRQFFADSALQWFLKEESRLCREAATGDTSANPTEPRRGALETLASFVADAGRLASELAGIADMCEKLVKGVGSATDVDPLISAACASSARLAADFQKWALSVR